MYEYPIDEQFKRWLEVSGIHADDFGNPRQWKAVERLISNLLAEKKREVLRLEESLESSAVEIQEMLGSMRRIFDQRCRTLSQLASLAFFIVDERGRCLEIQDGVGILSAEEEEREELLGRRIDEVLTARLGRSILSIVENDQEGNDRNFEVPFDNAEGPEDVWLVRMHRLSKAETGQGRREWAVIVRRRRNEEKDRCEEKTKSSTLQIPLRDALTGLPNRQALLESLELALERAQRYKRHGAIFFIDLDRFKEINDSVGHQAGDIVLKEIADRIRRIVRKSDIFGRLGGDEFLLILEEISSADTLIHVAQKIIDEVNRPIRIGDMNYHVGASIGITIFPRDSVESETLLRYADRAMYRAKQEGRNRYHFYSREIDREVKKRSMIEKVLKSALREEAFYLLFQPRLNLGTGTVTGVEALLRLDEHYSREMIPPSLFIPIAEESDIILRIGHWVFTQACRTLYEWQRRGAPSITMTINLSRRQLQHNEWTHFVDETLRKYQIKPESIEFDISESAFMSLSDDGYGVLKDLKTLGCGISIDDFGTGSSSLVLFQDCVDRLKIDRRFIQDITRNGRDRTLVKASIAMAQAMGLGTVAEGVETAEQKRYVQIMGCGEIQGFLIGKPEESDKALNLILSGYRN